MKDASEIKEMLAVQAEAVAQLLLPGGKRVGAEWCVGSIAGDPGLSLKVHLSGAKAGIWADFSSGEGGDLLDLWKAVKSVSFVDALKQARDYLGIKDDNGSRPFRQASPEKKYVRPVLDTHEELHNGGPVFDYLTKTRRLDIAILRKFRVQEMNHAKFGPTCIFPVFDNLGLAVDLVKYLAVKRAPDGKKMIWATAESRPHLFGWQAMDKNSRYVVITEGEIDALTVAGWGHAALSLPSGVKNLDWIEHDFEALARFDRIYLATDADEPGNLCAEAVAKRLGRERCFRLIMPGYKDANEAECSGKFIGPDFDDCLASAKTLDPIELRNASEFSDDLWRELNPTEDMVGSPTPWDIPWRVRPGEVTIWTGWSGHGKSLIINHLVLHDWANTGSNILIASLEVPARETIAQLSKMALVGLPKSRTQSDSVCEWLGGGFWFYDVVGVKPWREFLPSFAYAVRRYGIKRIVVDSLLRCGVAEDDYDGQREFVSALVSFAAEHAVHVHLVAHSRKKDDESKPPGKMDIRGAAAITDLVHNGVSVWRNKDKEERVGVAKNQSTDGTIPQELDAIPSAHIHFWKNRKGGVEPFRHLWLNPVAMQFLDSSSAFAEIYMKSDKSQKDLPAIRRIIPD